MLEQDVHPLQVQCAIPGCGQGPGEILEVLDDTNFADVRMRIQCRFDIIVTTKDVLCTAHWKSFNRVPRNSKCCDPHLLHQGNRGLRPKATERVSYALSSAAYPAVKIYPGAGVCRYACCNTQLDSSLCIISEFSVITKTNLRDLWCAPQSI